MAMIIFQVMIKISNGKNHFWQAVNCYRRNLGMIFKYHGYLFDLRHGIDLVEYSRQKFIASNNEAH